MRRLRWLCGAVLFGLLSTATVFGVALGQAGNEKKPEPDPKKDAPEPKKDAPEPKKLDLDSKEAPSAEKLTVPRGFRMYMGRFDIKSDPGQVGRLFDPVTHYGLNSVLGVFVRGIPKDVTDPSIPLIKKQEKIVEDYRPQRMGGFVAFLALKKDFAADDDRDALIAQVLKIAKSAEVPKLSVGLSEQTVAKEGDEKDGAAQTPPQVSAWGIAPEDAITVVFYDRLKIVKRWKFSADHPPGEAEIKEINDAVDEFMKRYK